MSALIGDRGAGMAEMQEAVQLQKQAVEEFKKIGIPDVEAQKLALEVPELVLSSEDERILKSAMEKIEEDPRLRQTQLEALEELETRGEEGFTEEDRARYEALRRRAGEDEEARQASILQSMAERGALDSGAQLAAQLSSSQEAAQRQAEMGEQMAGEAAAARRDALAQAAQVAGGMSAQDYSRDMNLAQARDQIARFNAAVAQRDTAARRQQGLLEAETANVQQRHNKGLIQQQFLNQLNRARGIQGASQGAAQSLTNMGSARAKAEQSRAGAVRGLVGAVTGFQMGSGDKKESLGSAGMGKIAGLFASDEDVKKNIKNVDASKFLDKLDGYEYEYKDKEHGDGKQIGIMAQDLEKVAPQAVVEKEDGTKMVDQTKLTGPILASLADLHKRLKKEEQDNYANGGVVGEDEDALNEYERLQLMGKAGAVGTEDDYRAMGYEEGGTMTEGRIVPGEEFAGDELPDRINSGESVHNLEMQQNIINMLRDYQRLRLDEMAEVGEVDVNEDAQEELIDIARGDTPIEEAELDQNVVEPTEKGMSRLIELLGMRK